MKIKTSDIKRIIVIEKKIVKISNLAEYDAYIIDNSNRNFTKQELEDYMKNFLLNMFMNV